MGQMRMTRTKIIHRNLTRVKQLSFPQRRHEFPFFGELLHPVVALVGDIHVPGRFVDRYRFGFVELASASAGDPRPAACRALLQFAGTITDTPPEGAAEDVAAGGEGGGGGEGEDY
jgi:hypothetical protein